MLTNWYAYQLPIGMLTNGIAKFRIYNNHQPGLEQDVEKSTTDTHTKLGMCKQGQMRNVTLKSFFRNSNFQTVFSLDPKKEFQNLEQYMPKIR